jgi:hypothetical protein
MKKIFYCREAEDTEKQRRFLMQRGKAAKGLFSCFTGDNR